MRPNRPSGFALDLAENDSPTTDLPLLPAMPILTKRTILPACDRRVTPIPNEFKLQLPPYPRELPPYAFHPAFTPGPPPKPTCIEVNATPIRVKYKPISGTINKISPRRVSTEVVVPHSAAGAVKPMPKESKGKVLSRDIALRHTKKVESPDCGDIVNKQVKETKEQGVATSEEPNDHSLTTKEAEESNYKEPTNKSDEPNDQELTKAEESNFHELTNKVEEPSYQELTIKAEESNYQEPTKAEESKFQELTNKTEEPNYQDLTILAPHLLLGMDTLLKDSVHFSNMEKSRDFTDVTVAWQFEVPDNTCSNEISQLVEVPTLSPGKTPIFLAKSSFHVEYKPIYKAFKQIFLILIAIALPNFVPAFMSMYRGDQQLLVCQEPLACASSLELVNGLLSNPVEKESAASEISTMTIMPHSQRVHALRDAPLKSLPSIPTKTQANETKNVRFSQSVIRFLPLAIIESIGLVQATLKVVATLLVTGILVALQ